MSKNFATWTGFAAIVMWASVIGLLKKVSLDLGPSLSVAVVYTLSTLILLAIFKLPNFRLISKKYLILSSLLFVAFEICFSFAISQTQSAQQAIEVGIVNYLWPSFTVIALVLFKELKFHYLLLVGLIIALSGIVYIQSGNGEMNLNHIIGNLKSNPLSYFLAFIGAIIWSLYCIVTKKLSNGHNPISFFFILISITLWFEIYFNHRFTVSHFDIYTVIYIVLAASVVGLGYAAWNIGIIHGNISLLVVASYFSPIISSVMSMIILQTTLSTTFWQGTALVTFGSLLCWVTTNWSVLQPNVMKIFKQIKHIKMPHLPKFR
ncbi:MAG: aromatic amino acid DMT transporter YddG [Acinetobacter sp.]